MEWKHVYVLPNGWQHPAGMATLRQPQRHLGFAGEPGLWTGGEFNEPPPAPKNRVAAASAAGAHGEVSASPASARGANHGAGG